MFLFIIYIYANPCSKHSGNAYCMVHFRNNTLILNQLVIILDSLNDNSQEVRR